MVEAVGKVEIWKIIRKLGERGLGILLITNSEEESKNADRITTLQDGRIR